MVAPSSPTEQPIKPTRQEPTQAAPKRLPTATQNATRLLPEDSDLTAVIDAWPDLPEALKAGIVAMLKAALGKRGG